MTKILIRNPRLVATMDDGSTEFNGGHILIEDGIVRSIGPDSPEVPGAEVIDAANMVVLPGFVNIHHHFYQTLTRNIPLMQDQPLFDWLKNHYEVWREITAEAVTVSSTTALLELMKSGVTTSTDHHYLFPQAASGDLIDAQIGAARALGVRFHATRGSMSLGHSKGGLPPDDVVQTEAEIQADVERLLAKYHDESEGSMVRLALAPCSPFSVTPESLRQSAEFAKANGIYLHTHLAETLDEEQFCLQQMGKRPAEFMADQGWFLELTWFAHSIFLNDDEIKQLGNAGGGVAHCPSSNMRLGSGIARIREMLVAGVKVGLGVDGSASNDSSNFLAEVRQALLISRLREGSNWLTAREVLRLATRGGAEAIGRSDIGQLAVGKRADLALFGIDFLEYAGAQSDPLAALVFTVRMRPVDWLIVDGQVRIRAGQSSVDEAALVARHNHIAAEILEKAGNKTGIDFLNKNGQV